MDDAQRKHWLEPSPAIAVDGGGRPGTHDIRVRDRRARFGDVETYIAECACGWTSALHTGRHADRAARRDGLAHVEGELPPYGHRGRGTV